MFTLILARIMLYILGSVLKLGCSHFVLVTLGRPALNNIRPRDWIKCNAKFRNTRCGSTMTHATTMFVLCGPHLLFITIPCIWRATHPYFICVNICKCSHKWLFKGCMHIYQLLLQDSRTASSLCKACPSDL